MSKSFRPLSARLAAASLALPLSALAGQNAAAVCSVAVDYLHGTESQPYRKEFVVFEGAPFVDDFSTATRQRQFTANVTKNNGDVLVSIDYFNDVGVLVAVGFNARLVVHGGGFESTSGSNAAYISSGVTPAAVGGNHITNYMLTCRSA